MCLIAASPTWLLCRLAPPPMRRFSCRRTQRTRVRGQPLACCRPCASAAAAAHSAEPKRWQVAMPTSVCCLCHSCPAASEGLSKGEADDEAVLRGMGYKQAGAACQAAFMGAAMCAAMQAEAPAHGASWAAASASMPPLCASQTVPNGPLDLGHMHCAAARCRCDRALLNINLLLPAGCGAAALGTCVCMRPAGLQTAHQSHRFASVWSVPLQELKRSLSGFQNFAISFTGEH